MTLRFTDGFDHYSFAQIGRKWTSTFGTQTITTSGTRFGIGSLLTFGTSASSNRLLKTLDNQATWIVGFAAKFVSFPTTERGFMSFADPSADQLTITFSGSGGILNVRRGTGGGTLLGSTTYNIPLNTWFYFEIKVKIDNTTGTVQIKINNQITLNLTGQDTQNTANAYANQILFNSNSTVTNASGVSWSIDDLYICDGISAGTPPNNDFLGDIKIETLYPNADGANLTWTPSTGTTHNTLVDETPANDDVDYISTNTANNKETLGFTDLVTTTGTVYGGQLLIAARADDGVTTHTIAPIIRHSGTDNIGTTSAALTASYTYYTQCYDKNPGSAAQFTISDVNADEYGCRMIA